MGADSVVQGPPTSKQLFGTEGIILDAQNNALYTFGKSRVATAVQSAIAALGIQTALTAITAAQTLMSQAFGAGALNIVGRTIRVSGTLIYSTTASNDATITIALKLGTVTLATITTTATSASALTGQTLQFSFTLSTASTGTAGTIVTVGAVDITIGTAVSTFIAPTTGPSAAVNLQTAETLTVTIAASAAIPTAQLLNGLVELIA